MRFLLVAVAMAAGVSAARAEEADLPRQVSRLVGQLNADAAAERDAAEQALLNLAGSDTSSVDRFLALLPADSDRMPLAVRDRLTRIRKQVEDRAARGAIAPTTVTLTVSGISAWEALQAIEKQTGNRVVDHRQPGGGVAGANAAKGPATTLTLKDAPYWSAIDEVLDSADLGVYNYAGEDGLAIVEREPGDRPRHGSAAYSGPFRLEVLEVQSQHNLRKPNQKSLKLQLEIAWEPRLRPIAVSQRATDLTVTDDAGNKLKASHPEAVLGAEVPTGALATELVLPFELPSRSVSSIASLKGKLRALVPGRQVKFEFDDLAHAAGKSHRSGGVEVTVDKVIKNSDIWEIHMRLRLDEANNALESHRGWAFENLSYLVDKQGTKIENAGLENTSQAKNEVGVAYFFDVSDGLDGTTWVYGTPAAIVEMSVEYELNDIELP